MNWKAMDKTVREGKLFGILKKWQRSLGLAHWDIVMEIKDQRDPDLQEAKGFINWVLPAQAALIKILDPVEWEDPCFRYVPEKTIIHELLHLHFAPCCRDLENNSLEHVAMEQAIIRISDALYRADQEALA